MSLYPTFESPKIEGFNDQGGAEYKNGLYFDFMTGDLKIDSTGKIVEASQEESWLQWCEKAIMSQWNSFLAYTDAYGMDIEYAMQQMNKQEREEALKQEVKNALLNDPANRTIDVGNFSFEWGTDDVRISFVVYGADGYTGKLAVKVRG